MIDILFPLIEVFRYLLRFRNYETKYVQLGCFHMGSTSFHSNLPGQGRPRSTILGIGKIDTGLPDGETVSLCVPSF